MIRFVYLGFIILFSFCFVFGGHDGQTGFIWQMELDFVANPFFELSFAYIVFYLVPLIGQALLITGLIGGATYIKSVLRGVVLLDITCAILLFIGLMIVNVKMISIPLFFIILSVIFINYHYNNSANQTGVTK